MSHGPTSGGISAAPNLTPLLDIVLQVLMFFMMCANFVGAQTTKEIALPKSVSVKPIDKSDPDWLYVNFKPFHLRDFENTVAADKLDDLKRNFQEGDACILVPLKEPMKVAQFRSWLKSEFEVADRIAKASGKKDAKVNTCIVIRADREANYGMVFQIMDICKAIGYTRMKMQASSKKAAGG
jgi:biopolymer transport protein ExbD